MKKMNFLSISKDLLTDEGNREKSADIIRRFSELVKDYQPNTEERAELAEIIGMNETELANVNTVGDFMRRIDLNEISVNNPKALKPLLGAIIGIVSIAFPAASVAGAVVVAVPDDLLAKVVHFGSVVDPVHIARTVTDSFAWYKQEKFVPDGDNQLPETQRSDETRRTLIAVYKDSLLSGLLRRLIETDDDEGDNVIGTRDGSVILCAWNEQFYTAMKEQIPCGVKCVFIGDIKETAAMAQNAKVFFSAYGAAYAFAGQNAFVTADPKALADKTVYASFNRELQSLPIPASVKAAAQKNTTISTVGKLLLFSPLLVKDFFDEQNMIKKQQLCYGLYKLYCNDLEAFLDSKEQ